MPSKPYSFLPCIFSSTDWKWTQVVHREVEAEQQPGQPSVSGLLDHLLLYLQITTWSSRLRLWLCVFCYPTILMSICMCVSKACSTAGTGEGGFCSIFSPSYVQWEAMTFFLESVINQMFRTLDKEVSNFPMLAEWRWPFVNCGWIERLRGVHLINEKSDSDSKAPVQTCNKWESWTQTCDSQPFVVLCPFWGNGQLGPVVHRRHMEVKSVVRQVTRAWAWISLRGTLCKASLSVMAGDT